MQPVKFCQSCSMPLDNPEMRGTEKDGSPSEEYCTYCYQGGRFTNPDMTVDDMKNFIEKEMRRRNIDVAIVNKAMDSLKGLKRWSTTVPQL